MASIGLPPPPINDAPGSFTWLEWYRQLRSYISTSGSVPWYVINFAGSNINDIQDRDHNELQNLQGGRIGERYHLTAAQAAALTAGDHNTLDGLQGGTINERYHITENQYNGMVIGPNSAVNNNIAVFDGMTGKIIKDATVSPYDIGLAYKYQILAGLVPGFLTEFYISDPNYPFYTQQNYDFRLTRVNATTLGISNTGPIIFYGADLFTSPLNGTIKTFPATTFNLSGLGAYGYNTDGLHFVYVSIDINGNLNFTPYNVAQDAIYVQLGRIFIKRVGGVFSFLDDLPIPVITTPNLAGIDNYVRVTNPISTTIACITNGPNLTLNKLAGAVIAECVDWGGPAPVHEKQVAGQTPAQFFRVSAGTTSGTTLGTLQTTVDPTLYWNGTTLVSPGGPNTATVQRLLVGVGGGLMVQYGETAYANFDDAKDAIFSATFTEILEPYSSIEIARVALQRSCTNLQDNATAYLVSTNGPGGGGSGGGAAPVTVIETGTMSNFGAAIPPDWLLCNGQAVSRAAYPELFAYLGTSWGDGDGSTTFNLPNVQEYTYVGYTESGAAKAILVGIKT